MENWRTNWPRALCIYGMCTYFRIALNKHRILLKDILSPLSEIETLKCIRKSRCLDNVYMVNMGDMTNTMKLNDALEASACVNWEEGNFIRNCTPFFQQHCSIVVSSHTLSLTHTPHFAFSWPFALLLVGFSHARIKQIAKLKIKQH